MSTLLSVGDLVFDLNGAGAGFDHALGKQVGGFFVTKARVDISNDRHDVGFVAVDSLNDGICITAVRACFVQFHERVAQLARISLLEEGVNFFYQIRYRCLFMHALVRQRTEL